MSVPGTVNRPAVIGDVLFVHFHHARGDLPRLRDNPERGDMHAGPADRHRTRIEGAVAGLDLSRVALHYVDVLDRNLQHVGGDLRQRRGMAVALAHGARINRDPAARIDADPGAFPAAAVEADQRQPARRRHAAHMRIGGNANAAIAPFAPQFVAFAAARPRSRTRPLPCRGSPRNCRCRRWCPLL